MTCRCPVHGPQLCALTSPDAISTAPPSDTSNLVSVFLVTGHRVEYAVTLTKQFAQQYGIVGERADYEQVFVYSEWFDELVSMCARCFTERWPELIARYQNQIAAIEAGTSSPNLDQEPETSS